MYENRGPEARLRQGIDALIETAERIPQLVENLEKLVTTWSREGVMLHAETLMANAAHRTRGLIRAAPDMGRRPRRHRRRAGARC
jgi:hypothetical protein